VQRILTLRARGQALIETAIALPAFLLVMFGVVWALQTGVLGERVELVARYGGMVSAEINPYQQYSLYAAYSAAAGAPLATSCSTPPPGLIQNGAPLANPATPTLAFWQPSQNSATASTTCGRALASGSSLSAPMLLGRSAITVHASSDVPMTLQPLAGAQSQRGAVLNAFRSPDMATLIACYSELQAALGRSIDPSTDPSPATPTAPIAQFASGGLSLGSGCGG
jgi:TadE-like protein